MLLKVISSFLAIQVVSFALWQGVQAWNRPSAPITQSAPVVVINEDEDEDVVSHEAAKIALQEFPEVRFYAKTTGKRYTALDDKKKEEITSVLSKLPAGHISTLKNLILDYNPEAHRGLGGRNLIIIRGVNMDSEEFFGVLIHEIGHSVDLGYLSESDKDKESEFTDNKTPVYEDDPSLGFYRISWKDEENFKKDTSNKDFVSGYALTDPFEDFAETYVYYVLHNKDFKSKTQTSEKLLQKYEFMKNTVFDGKEFDTGELLTEKLYNRPWDITVLSYNLSNFLKS